VSRNVGRDVGQDIGRDAGLLGKPEHVAVLSAALRNSGLAVRW